MARRYHSPTGGNRSGIGRGEISRPEAASSIMCHSASTWRASVVVWPAAGIILAMPAAREAAGAAQVHGGYVIRLGGLGPRIGDLDSPAAIFLIRHYAACSSSLLLFYGDFRADG